MDIADLWLAPAPFGWEGVVEAALREDLGSGDLTAGVFEAGARAEWYVEAQAEGVVCGLGIAAALLPGARGGAFRDGAAVRPGDVLIEGAGGAAEVLSRERTSLNFLMLLSGTATLTAQFVREVAGTRARIVDTRKTVPGLRTLQKYAVRCGGGHNHRMGLYDGAMLKDNHIAAAGSISAAVRRLREQVGHMVKIEVECENLVQVEEAVAAGADVILLDNMNPERVAAAMRQRRAGVLFEVSGGVRLETVRPYAEAGADLISVGALTHSAPALSLHLELR